MQQQLRTEQERVRAVAALQKSLIVVIEARTGEIASLEQRVALIDDPDVLEALMTAVVQSTSAEAIDALLPPRSAA